MAKIELAQLLEMIHQKDKASAYYTLANRLKSDICRVFSDKRGMLLASTGRSNQADVWSTALAVCLGVLDGDQMKRTAQFLTDSYKNGILSKNGNIRHVLTSDDYSDSTAWESTKVHKNRYQNGAYWGTPTGWVCYSIAKVDIGAAKQLAKEYIAGLRADDFRKGDGHGAPWECYNEILPQNPVYLTTVSCPYIVFSGGN